MDYSEIVTRKQSTRKKRIIHVFLRDNPDLKKIFDILHRENIRCLNDIDDPSKQEEMRKLIFDCEITFDYDPNEICQHITFTNSIPLEGKFEEGIPRFIEIIRSIKPTYV